MRHMHHTTSMTDLPRALRTHTYTRALAYVTYTHVHTQRAYAYAGVYIHTATRMITCRLKAITSPPPLFTSPFTHPNPPPQHNCTYAHAYMHEHAYTHTYACTRMHTCIRPRTRTHTCICMQAYAYIHIHTSREARDASRQPSGFGPRRRPNYTIKYSYNYRELVKNKKPICTFKDLQSPFTPARANILNNDRSTSSPVGGGEEPSPLAGRPSQSS